MSIQLPLSEAVAMILVQLEWQWSYVPPPTTPLSNYRQLSANIEKAWTDRKVKADA